MKVSQNWCSHTGLLLQAINGEHFPEKYILNKKGEWKATVSIPQTVKLHVKCFCSIKKKRLCSNISLAVLKLLIKKKYITGNNLSWKYKEISFIQISFLCVILRDWVNINSTAKFQNKPVWYVCVFSVYPTITTKLLQ